MTVDRSRAIALEHDLRVLEELHDTAWKNREALPWWRVVQRWRLGEAIEGYTLEMYEVAEKLKVAEGRLPWVS